MSRQRFMGLPRGSRDLLPGAASRRRRLTRTLTETFEAWGYAFVLTPTVEYYDVLATGLSEADRRLCVRFIEAHSGELVALRADLTPQIARMVAGHRGEAWPKDAVTRLSYAADVVRQPAGEYHQAGVEMIGDADPAADAELVALAFSALKAAGLSAFRFDVSHRAVAGGVIAGLNLGEPERDELARLLGRKDRGSVVQFLDRHGVDAKGSAAAAGLCDLFGPPAVLERARAVIQDPAPRSGLDQLQAVVDHLERVHPEAAAAVDLDLGEVRGFDYYTGLRLRVWAAGVDRPVLRGGRYDDLLGRYGAPDPATGFAIDLDALDAALPRNRVEVAQGARVVAIHPGVDPAQGRLEAARRCEAARAAGERAWVQPAVELSRARALAEFWGATALTFIEADGKTVVAATHRHGESGWARENDA